MSVHALEIPSRDVNADALGLVVGAPAPTPLVELRLTDRAAGTLTLGILGASHVVTGTANGRSMTEQVSCDAVAAGGRPLPHLEERSDYRFTSRTENVDLSELRCCAEKLRISSTGAGWLCAGFPGDRDALTALSATAIDGEWRWATWHLYPQDNSVIVRTESRWRP